MKRIYAKPAMTVERFLANVVVATCTETWDDVKIDEQTIYCYRSNRNERLFNVASSCATYPTEYAFVPGGTYTQSQLQQYLPHLNVDSGSGGSINVPASGGVVLIWPSGMGANKYCYGLATATISSILNSSY